MAEDLNQQLQSLKTELEEKEDTIFELSASMASLEAETNYKLQKSEQESSHKIRKLNEELRMLQNTANQLILSRNKQQQQQQQQRRRITTSPPVPEQQQGQEQSNNASHSNNDSKNKTTPQQYSNNLASFLLAQQQKNIPVDYQRFLTGLLHRSDDYQDEILFYLLAYCCESTTTETLENSLQLLLEYLYVSPPSCRRLTNRMPKSTIQNLDDETARKLMQIECQLEGPFGGSCCLEQCLSPSKLSFCQKFLQEQILNNSNSVGSLRILSLLVTYEYDIPEQYLDDLVDVWSNAIRLHVDRRDVAFRTIRNIKTNQNAEPSLEWMEAALRLFCELIQKKTTFNTWLPSKRASTVVAACLDILEYYNDRSSSLLVECVQFFKLLLVVVDSGFFFLLFVKQAQESSTAELWHRAPTAAEVLGELLYKIRNNKTTTELRDTVVQVFQMILLYIENDRKQQQQTDDTDNNNNNKPCGSLYFWDVLGSSREYYTVAACMILQDKQSSGDTIREMVAMQLDELSEDQAEKYADV